jgi:hypothetical protein
VVTDLVLIALGIALQPFRLSAFIVILSTENGNRKGLGFILGWLACLVLVIAAVVLIKARPPDNRHRLPGGGTVADRPEHPPAGSRAHGPPRRPPELTNAVSPLITTRKLPAGPS